MKYKTWTENDIKLLSEMYKTHDIKEIAKYFNVSISNIRAVASNNKIRKRESNKKKKINLCELVGFDEYTYG